MTVTTIRTIKPAGGGDYFNLTDWDTARRGNLVTGDKIEIAEVYGGGNCVTADHYTASGLWTTDASHYVEIRAAAGEQHNGVFDTAKAYAETSTVGSVFSTGTIKFLKITGMQLRSTLNSTGAQVIFHNTSATSNLTIDKCILVKTGNAAAGIIYASHTNPIIVKNSILLRIGGTSSCDLFEAEFSDAVAFVYNCIIIGGAGLNDSGVKATNSSITTQNCYIRTNNGFSYVTTGTGTVSNGTKDATSGTDAILLQNIPYSTATFQSVTAGSENLRLVAGPNSLIDNGVDLSGLGVTYDIIGVVRPQGVAFDIGAFESAPTTINPGFFSIM